MKKILRRVFLFVIIALFALLPITENQQADAAWNASYIISDVEFTAKNTMTEAEIQAFLAAKGSYLENYTVPAARYVEWQGVNYYESPWIGPIGSEVNATGWKASKVIYNVAQWYNINPQVILATIQKENILVTTYPAYYGLVQWAMGYAYTDGGIINVCSTATNHNPTGSCAGFAMQVDWGGGMLGYWSNAGGHYNYPVGSTKYIAGVATYIGNAATSVLYAYTPHFHGNQNFRYFYDLWFVPYSYGFVTATPPPTYLHSGQIFVATLTLKNTGSVNWERDGINNSTPMRLNIIEGNSLYAGDSRWVGTTRIKMKTDSVAPGENGVFEISLKMPSTVGKYKIRFVPLVENVTGITEKAMPDIGMEFNTENTMGKIYRFWSDLNQSHFYTISPTEKNHIITAYPNNVWKYEKQDFGAYTKNVGGKVPVYRFWSDSKQTHFYTSSWSEREYVVKKYPNTWNLEGVKFYVNQNSGTGLRPVYRFWSDSKQTHFYTQSESEKNYVIATWPNVWKFEGVAWYSE